MSAIIDASAWPVARLGEALAALARRARLGPRELDPPPPPPAAIARDPARLGAWIEAAAERITVEAEPVEASYHDIDELVRGAGPALFRLPGEGDPRFVAVLGAASASLRLLGPDLDERRVDARTLRDALCASLEAAPRAEAARLLDLAGVPPRRRARALDHMVREQLAGARVGAAWLLRLPQGAPATREIQAAGLVRGALALLVARAGEYALGLAAWWMLGLGALSGRLDRGYLIAWALVLLTLVPFRALAVATQGRLAVSAGALVKRRLLAGSLALSPEEVRGDGAGALLGRVIESEAVESLSISAGFEGITAVVELAVSIALLAVSAGGALSVAVLAASIALVFVAGSRYLRRRRAWTEARVAMTHDLVERMVGHRTRLAQQHPDRWHEGEDEATARYLALSRAMDHAAVAIAALPRAFLVAAAAALAPAFVSGTAGASSLALGLGATLLAFRALGKLSAGITSLAGALIAWEKVKPLWDAAGRSDRAAEPLLALAPRALSDVLVDARELTFRYHEHGKPILRGVTLRIGPRDRLLLEGSSGGGKSTLGSILAGLRAPENGLLLLGGLDRHTLGGAGFRRLVASAPQFHENHVLSATFSFNLLMGRAWPPDPADLDEARSICEELDLGALLARMPAGPEQMVGETGWQLSHGEKSRLFIARALLQRADLIVLDESFAALDPATLERALRCVLARARAVLVIAHP